MKKKDNTTLVKVTSVAYYGMEVMPVTIEISLMGRGLPRFDIVGLPGKEVSESKHRIITALTTAGVEFPARKIVVNLAPADIPKEGSAYDFPIAVGLLSAILGFEINPYNIYYGELSLDGSLSDTKKCFLAQLFAHEHKYENVFLPLNLQHEYTCFSGVKVFGVKSLQKFIDYMRGNAHLSCLDFKPYQFSKTMNKYDFSQIIGQENAKRALEIAAAGGHNVLFEGPPGSGKTLLSKTFPTILPPLSYEDAIEVTKLHVIKGKHDNNLITERPYRSPHHTISYSGMVGGGSIPLPGEVSLSHKGVLFLDEIPEFSRKVIESLRQPLEDQQVTITRSRDTFTYPSEFSLLAACNPCPCGYYKHEGKKCKCTPRQIENYKKRISGPIYDRIDLYVFVKALEIEKISLGLKKKTQSEKSEDIMKRVLFARSKQEERFKTSSITLNSQMNKTELEKYCPLSSGVRSLLDTAALKLDLSTRAYFKTLKVARTIADLEGVEDILVSHISEALQYRASS